MSGIRNNRSFALLCSVSLIGLAAALPGFAQEAAVASDVETVIVTGVRQSLKAAQDVKRDADSVIEVVTATDLGNFDDNNVADVLQRVPGLQIERDDASTDGDRVSIRGIGSNFVVTSFSGRTPISTGSGGERNLRSFNYNVIPTELISGLVVMKTPTSDRIEQGLAGSVDVQTLRPLEARYAKGKNFFGSAEVRGVYNTTSEDIDPRQSFIFGGRTKDKKLGFYVSAVKGDSFVPTYQLQNRDGYTPAGTTSRATFRVDTNNNGIYDNGDTFYSNGGACGANGFAPVLTAPTGTNLSPTPPIGANNAVTCDQTPRDIFNGIITYRQLNKYQESTGFSAAIQWRPTSRIDIVLDYQKAGFDETGRTTAAAFNLNGGNAPVNNSSAFFKPGAVQILTEGGPTSAPYVAGWDGAGLIGYLGAENSGAANTTAATNTSFKDILQVVNSVGQFSGNSQLNMGGLNFKYRGEGWRNSTDISYSETTYGSIFTQMELRQRYRNAYTLGDVGFSFVDGFPVVTNLQNLSIAAKPTFGDVLNSMDCATRICVEYNGLGSMSLGASPTTQFVNSWTNAINMGQAVRKQERAMNGTNLAIRSDFSFEVADGGPVTSFDAGFRYSSSDIDSVVSVNHRYAGMTRSTALGIGCTLAQGTACMRDQQSAFIAAITAKGGLTTIGEGTPAAVTVVGLEEQAACAFNPGFCTETLANGGLIARPNNSFTYKEDLSAAYINARFEGQIGIRFTGNIGLRIVKTEWESTAGTVFGRSIVIPTTGTGPVVEYCKSTVAASLVAGACPTVVLLPDAQPVNTQSGTMNPNGSFTTGSTQPLNRPMTDEASTYLDAVYYNNSPGSLRNPNYTTVRDEYADVLPSLNLNFRVTDRLRIRFGYGTVVSRPQPNEIAPTAAIAVNDNDTYEASVADDIVAVMNTGLTYEQAINTPDIKALIGANTNNIITQGNPSIKPYKAQNYDITFEYYTPNDGSIILGAFYKDVKDFILQRLGDDYLFVDGYTFNSEIDANTIALQGKPIPFRVRRYENYSDAEVYGYEFSVNQPFTFLPKPFDGLGINANYTYVDSKFEKDIGNYGFGFPGSSKNNYNVVIYYGSKALDMRVAYNYRDPYVRSLAGSGSQSNLTRFTDAQERLDVSMTWKPTTKLSVRLTAQNLTDQDRYDYSFAKSATMDRFSATKSYTLSLRYRY